MQLIITSGGKEFDFGDVAPWSPDEHRKLQGEARRIMRDHGHLPGDAKDKVVRDHCGACVLDAGRKSGQPNYAGWLRVYIQAGVPLTTERIMRELEHAKKDNPRYYDGILRDLATFISQSLADR